MEITKETILKAWREPSYAESLPADVRKAIPARPTGGNGEQLSDADLEQAAGGTLTAAVIAGGAGVGSILTGYGVGKLLD